SDSSLITNLPNFFFLDASNCSSPPQFFHAIYHKERQLEGLLHAVESRGGARTPCLLLPAKADSRLGQHWYPLPVLLCKVFRWPDLRHSAEVKRLCCCESYGKAHPELVCCNPHHLSRLCELGRRGRDGGDASPLGSLPLNFYFSEAKPSSPPPKKLSIAVDPLSGKVAFSCFSAPPLLHYPPPHPRPSAQFLLFFLFFSCSVDSQVLQDSGDRSHWCVVAYWEEKMRVGRLYSVQEPSLDIFYDLPQGNGFCLGHLNSDNKSQLVQKVRSKIGYGIQLTKEVDGVWVYNRSSYPIFIKSATLDNPDSRMLLVHKVFPGFSIKAFDYEKAYSLQRPNDHEFMQRAWGDESHMVIISRL
uniref:Mothers against decapentaplegic homolog n=1 Tax=Strix occidentalis caurina TaxID=311401 RepID=A0A8D0F3A8_STROC